MRIQSALYSLIIIELTSGVSAAMMPQGSTGNPSQDLSDLLKSISNLKPAGGQHKVRMTVKKARPYLTRHVADRMYTNEMVRLRIQHMNHAT